MHWLCVLDRKQRWRNPRIGGYNQTIAFPNGTPMDCRQEHPQILPDPVSKEPIGISNRAQCPRRYVVFKGSMKMAGDMDGFTRVQMLDGRRAIGYTEQ